MATVLGCKLVQVSDVPTNPPTTHGPAFAAWQCRRVGRSSGRLHRESADTPWALHPSPAPGVREEEAADAGRPAAATSSHADAAPTSTQPTLQGPVDRKMVINALNCGASTFMADFEGDPPTSGATIMPAASRM